jgi:hypothetical protein
VRVIFYCYFIIIENINHIPYFYYLLEMPKAVAVSKHKLKADLIEERGVADPDRLCRSCLQNPNRCLGYTCKTLGDFETGACASCVSENRTSKCSFYSESIARTLSRLSSRLISDVTIALKNHKGNLCHKCPEGDGNLLTDFSAAIRAQCRRAPDLKLHKINKTNASARMGVTNSAKDKSPMEQFKRMAAQAGVSANRPPKVKSKHKSIKEMLQNSETKVTKLDFTRNVAELLPTSEVQPRDSDHTERYSDDISDIIPSSQHHQSTTDASSVAEDVTMKSTTGVEEIRRDDKAYISSELVVSDMEVNSQDSTESVPTSAQYTKASAVAYSSYIEVVIPARSQNLGSRLSPAIEGSVEPEHSIISTIEDSDSETKSTVAFTSPLPDHSKGMSTSREKLTPPENSVFQQISKRRQDIRSGSVTPFESPKRRKWTDDRIESLTAFESPDRKAGVRVETVDIYQSPERKRSERVISERKESASVPTFPSGPEITCLPADAEKGSYSETETKEPKSSSSADFKSSPGTQPNNPIAVYTSEEEWDQVAIAGHSSMEASSELQAAEHKAEVEMDIEMKKYSIDELKKEFLLLKAQMEKRRGSVRNLRLGCLEYTDTTYRLRVELNDLQREELQQAKLKSSLLQQMVQLARAKEAFVQEGHEPYPREVFDAVDEEIVYY